MNPTVAIREDALKLVKRHQAYAAELASSARRKARETGLFVPPTIRTPGYWAVDPGFNPYHVRSHADLIGSAVRKRIANGSYCPRTAVEYEVPKPDGSMRRVSVFQVADNAVSRLIYKSLIQKNAPRLSPRCYAYRSDLNRHDAIFYANQQLRTHLRVFVAEYDFKAFFDNISHDHILSTLASKQFITTSIERKIVERFLRAPSLPQEAYESDSGTPKDRGIPQGTSISLFLANIAAFSLDQKLEQLGVGFARFADDTLIWSSNYSELNRAVDAIADTSVKMGVQVNLQKSPGISVLHRPGEAVEMAGKTYVDFLGVSISKDRLSYRNKVITRVKDRISYLLYSLLVQPLRNGHFQPERVAPPIDRAYVVALFQIRRYLYGGLNESKVRRYSAGVVPRIKFFGALANAPLVDDEDQMRELDGWLVHTAYQTLLLRRSLIHDVAPDQVLPRPHGLRKHQLISLRGQSSGGASLDLRLPSFLRMSRLLRRASFSFGPGLVGAPGTGGYY